MADRYYYNLIVTNTSTATETVPCRFEANISQPFIRDASKWDVSVIRFKLPNYSTPIMTFVDGSYKITMQYKTISNTTTLIYQSRSPSATYRGIYEIQHFIDIINTAFAKCWTDLNALITLPDTVADAPYMVYDNVTKLISLIANKAYYGVTVTDPITIYVNNGLFKSVQGLPIVSTGVINREFQLLVQDAKNNTFNTNFWQMEQQAPSFDIMSDFNSIILTSDMPIQSEYIGTSTAFPIIQDFIPSDLSISTFHNNITYNAIVPYRKVSLCGSTPLYNIHFNAYFSNNAEVLTELQLPQLASASIKLMFTKKKE